MLTGLCWWLVRWPVAERAVPSRAGSCGLPAECLADAELWGATLLAIVLDGLAWLVMLVGLLGVCAVAIGWLVHHRWPERRLARATAAMLTYAPAVLLATVAVWLTTIALG